VFKYAQRLQEVGPQDYIFEETKKIGNIKFDFADKGQALNNCVSLAGKLQRFEAAEDIPQLIRSSYCCDSFDKARTIEMGEHLADPANTLIFLTSQSLDAATLPKKEKWYKIDYSQDKFTPEFMAKLRNPVVSENSKKLDLPPENTLLPTDFEILAKNQELSAKPFLLKQWNETDLWYQKDDRFDRPKGYVGAKIYTGDLNFGQTPLSRVFAEVWKGCLSEYLREFAYMADCAALTFSSALAHDNIDLRWNGYNDSLVNFVSETIERINKMAGEDVKAIFEQVKEKLLQEWKNFYLQQTFRLAYQYLDPVLMSSGFERKLLRQILEEFKYDDFKGMLQQWLKSGRMVWYVHGNVSKENAIHIVEKARSTLNLQETHKDDLVSIRCLSLLENNGQYQRVDFDVEDKTNENSCLVSYYQYGLEKNDLKSKLLNDVLMQYMDEPTFNQLRTIEQLGYVVFSKTASHRDVIGSWFLIQSPKMGCAHIKNSLNKHLATMRQKVIDLTDEDFKTQQEAVYTQIAEKDKSIGEVFNRFWSHEFATHRYLFDRQEKECAALRELTKADFQAYFEKIFFTPETVKRLDIHFNSEAHKQQEEESEFKITDGSEHKHKSLSSLKRNNGYYADPFKFNMVTTEWKEKL